jgi:hypothetical protein
MEIEFFGNGFKYRDFTVDMYLESQGCDCCSDKTVWDAWNEEHGSLSAYTLEEIVIAIDNHLNGAHNHIVLTANGKEHKIYVNQSIHAKTIIDALNETKEKLHQAFLEADVNLIVPYIKKHQMKEIHRLSMYISTHVRVTDRRVLEYVCDFTSNCKYIIVEKN